MSAAFFLGNHYSILHPLSASRSLRSADKGLLSVARTRLKQRGDRAFAVAAPRLWNCLPPDVRLSPSITTFKSRLKTHLYSLAFPASCPSLSSRVFCTVAMYLFRAVYLSIVFLYLSCFSLLAFYILLVLICFYFLFLAISSVQHFGQWKLF